MIKVGDKVKILNIGSCCERRCVDCLSKDEIYTVKEIKPNGDIYIINERDAGCSAFRCSDLQLMFRKDKKEIKVYGIVKFLQEMEVK